MRVLVANGARPALRRWLATFRGVEVVGEAASAALAEGLATVTQPDLVLVDLHHSGRRGVVSARRIHARFPHVRVVALGSAEDLKLLQEAGGSGAWSYILEHWEPDDLFQVIRLVMAGRRPNFVGASPGTPPLG